MTRFSAPQGAVCGPPKRPSPACYHTCQMTKPTQKKTNSKLAHATYPRLDLAAAKAMAAIIKAVATYCRKGHSLAELKLYAEGIEPTELRNGASARPDYWLLSWIMQHIDILLPGVWYELSDGVAVKQPLRREFIRTRNTIGEIDRMINTRAPAGLEQIMSAQPELAPACNRAIRAVREKADRVPPPRRRRKKDDDDQMELNLGKVQKLAQACTLIGTLGAEIAAPVLAAAVAAKCQYDAAKCPGLSLVEQSFLSARL